MASIKAPDVKIGYIYLIKNIANNKVYIGQTINKRGIKGRFKDHCYDAASGRLNTHLARAIRKYGSSLFSVLELESCEASILNDREKYWISKYDSYKSGYNMSEGGDNSSNSSTPEAKAKISLSKKGVKSGPMPESTRKAISTAKLQSGYSHSEETVLKIKEKRNGYILTESHKENIGIGVNKTKKFSLAVEDVEKIVNLILEGDSDLSISRIIGTSRKSVWSIRNRRYNRPETNAILTRLPAYDSVS